MHNKSENEFGLADLYGTFQGTHWDLDQLENLFESATNLMNKISTEPVIRALYYKMPNESPITHYRKRIHNVYKKKALNSRKFEFKVERIKQKKYNICEILLIQFVLVVVYLIGAILELTHFKF